MIGIMTEDEPAAAKRGDDPELFLRWLTIEHLLTSARELQARGGGAWPSLAVISADAATEVMLFLVAVTGANPPSDRAKYEEVYDAAVAELRDGHHVEVTGSLRARILNAHRARNAAIHEGNGPTVRAVATALTLSLIHI